MKNTKNHSSLVQNGKHRDSTLINAFYDLLKIKSDLFKDLILNDSVLYMPAQNKNKGIFQKKNITRSIQERLEVLEEEGKKEVSKTYISLQGCIIRNSFKL